jgi:hypothetical protein
VVARTVHVPETDHLEGHARVAAAIDSIPDDAVVQLRVTGEMPAA